MPHQLGEPVLLQLYGIVGVQVVNADDLLFFAPTLLGKESFRDGRSDEAGRAGDKHAAHIALRALALSN